MYILSENTSPVLEIIYKRLIYINCISTPQWLYFVFRLDYYIHFTYILCLEIGQLRTLFLFTFSWSCFLRVFCSTFDDRKYSYLISIICRQFVVREDISPTNKSCPTKYIDTDSTRLMQPLSYSRFLASRPTVGRARLTGVPGMPSNHVTLLRRTLRGL